MTVTISPRTTSRTAKSDDTARTREDRERHNRAERARRQAKRQEMDARRDQDLKPSDGGTKAASLPHTDTAVAPARAKKRHYLLLLSFLTLVVAPIVLSGVYLYRHAADQYASHAAFSVQKEEGSSAIEILGGFTQLSGGSTNDTDVINSYILSQELVLNLENSVGLRERFSRVYEVDPVFALAPDATVEDLVAYWNRMLHVSYTNSEGIIELELKAFRPDDAQIILSELISQSTLLINEINQIAREDQIRFARDELDKSVARLKDARVAMSEFRETNRLVDPTADIQGQMGVINSLEQELASTMIELDLLSVTDGRANPRTDQFRRKITAIETLISNERAKMAAPDETGLTSLVGRYESLLVDTEFATEAYKSALVAYDAALAQAQRQSRYLATHIQPTLASSPEYPRRTMILGFVGSFLLMLWVLGTLIAYSLRDRR